MRKLVKELFNDKITRRGFLAGMAAAGYSAAAARSALQSVEPFVPGSEVAPKLARQVRGTGGELLVDQIVETGSKYMFVTNGSGLGPLCDALVNRPQLQLIQTTMEGQTVAVADGYAKASGKVAFGMYSRVGLPHSTSNMYNSMKDRTPVVMLQDHAEVMREGTDSHEDVDDWLEAVKQYTKWRWVVHQPERIPEWLRQAVKVATVQPCGPTMVRIPRDLMLRENVTATVFAGDAFSIPMELRPDMKAVEKAAKLLVNASAPVLYVGPEVSQMSARKKLTELAELLGMSVATHRSFFCDFPNFHSLFMADLSTVEDHLKKQGKSIDLIMNFGARAPFGGRYARTVPMIHASVDPETIGRNTPLAAALVGDLNQVAHALVEAVKSMGTPKLKQVAAERAVAAKAYTDRLKASRVAAARRSTGSPVPWQRLMWEMNELLDPDAVIVEEVGTEGKILNFFPFDDDKKMKIGRTEGRALGWGCGASAGVKLALPNRQCVSFHGDGGFLFAQTDALWTHSRYDIPVMQVILNNRSYEEVRWNIMGEGGASGKAGRDYIAYLGDPDVDFTRLASAYNIPGAVVENTDQLRPAIEKGIRTLRDGRPFMLDVRTKTFGPGAELTWYPKYSLAEHRERNA
jgi:benzoylformate decarboxylase